VKCSIISYTRNLLNSSDAMVSRKYKPPTPWDIAKPLLEADYLEGRATDDMFPRDVVKLRWEYSEVNVKNFRSNWLALKKRISTHKARAEEDELMYLHDMTIYTLAKDRDELWHGSAAERLLKKDMEQKRHERLHPSLFYLARPEYQQFEYQIFRKHIHQELRSSIETPYWIYKRNKRKQIAIAIQADRGQDDLDFFVN
jgi:hypothetical protein